MTVKPIDSIAPAVLREDVLVSVCFGALPANANSFDSVAKLAAEIKSRFRFYELIVIAEEEHHACFLPLVHAVENLRLFTVRGRTAYYSKRAIAAEEAIGDVVLLSSSHELNSIDALAMITSAIDEEAAVLAVRSPKMVNKSLSAVLGVLGKLAGFNVNLQSLQTLALPRTLLNQLLSHPDPDLALRFLPKSIGVPVVLVASGPDAGLSREEGLSRRLALLQKLLVHIAPRLLLFVSISSAILAMIGFSFGFYVLGVWIFRQDVAPGWLTLSGALSLTAFFLGICMTGLSLGLQHLMSKNHQDRGDGITSEVNRVDLFAQVASKLNVEFERGAPDSTKDAAP